MSGQHHVFGLRRASLFFNASGLCSRQTQVSKPAPHSRCTQCGCTHHRRSTEGGAVCHTAVAAEASPTCMNQKGEKKKNSSIFLKHFCHFLSLLPVLCFYFHPTFGSNYQTTSTQASPLLQAWATAQLCPLRDGEKKRFRFSLQIFLLFPLFKGSQAKNISGAIRRQSGCGGSRPRAVTHSLIQKSHPKHDLPNAGQIASCFTAAISIFCRSDWHTHSHPFQAHSAGPAGFLPLKARWPSSRGNFTSQ